jgi:hypothetical protein
VTPNDPTPTTTSRTSRRNWSNFWGALQLYVQADNAIRQAYRKNGALPYLKEALLMSEFFVYITRNDDYETRSQMELIF